MKLLKTVLLASLISVALTAHAKKSHHKDDDDDCNGGGGQPNCSLIFNFGDVIPGVSTLTPQGSPYYSGGDYFSSNILNSFGGSLTFEKAGLSLEVTSGYKYKKYTADTSVIMDLNPQNGGLGVVRQGKTTGKYDAVNKGEYLTLVFSEVVTLIGASFNENSHKDFKSSSKYDFEFAYGTGGLGDYDDESLGDFDGSFTGDTFSFRYDDKYFYLGSLELDYCETPPPPPPPPIPEPETYALMIAGLGLVGFMARRRKVMQGASA